MLEKAGVKSIALKVAGTGQDAAAGPLLVKPGTTVNDLLESCELNGYAVFKQNGVELKPSDDLFQAVDNGEVLYATTPAIVGC